MPDEVLDRSRSVKPGYRPEIDGLRAIAVCPVVLFHAGFGFPGGFVGVDIFFVISGFLVTGIIARSVDQGRFSILDFYCRRIRRIFPAAAVVTAAILLFGFRSSLAQDYVQVSKAAVAQSGFVSNVFFWLDSGYFSRDVLTKPFLHFWSLSVEEQFYLLFPALLSGLFFVAKTRRFVQAFVIAVGLASFALSVYGTHRHPSATFYLLPTRAWELMAGAWLALSGYRITSPKPSEAASWLGILLFGISFFAISETSQFPGFWAALPVAGTILIIASNTGESTLVGRLLSMRAVVFVGLISYSLYLWHWPIMAYARYLVLDPPPLMMTLAVAASFGIACLSWRWIEQPIRQQRILAGNRALVLPSAGVWVVLLLVPLAVINGNGLPGRFDDSQQRLVIDATWNGNTASRDVEDVTGGDVPRIGNDNTPERQPDFVLWGDSHAMTFTQVLDDAAKRVDRCGVATLHGGTPPIPGVWRTGMPNCLEFNAAVMELIERNPIRDVILVSRWSVYVEGYSESDPKTDGRSDQDVYLSDSDRPSQTGEESLSALNRQILLMAERMREKNIRLWLVRQVPVQSSRIAESAVRNMLIGLDVNPIIPTNRTKHQHQQSRIERFYSLAAPALAETGGGVLDLGDRFFDASGEAVIRADGDYLYRDDDHLSFSGALRLKPQLIDLLQKSGRISE